MSNTMTETVTQVHHWNESLFSFKTTREPGFRFKNGHFVMVGLEGESRPLMRAYSIASANYEEELEFFSIKVADGPLTSRLQHLQIGDPVLVSKKPTGTLVTDNMLPGKRLYLIATGTGLAPFLSIIKDYEIYEQFDQVVLVHGVRFCNELAYVDYIEQELPKNEFFGELVRDKLLYYPTVTREAFKNNGRVTQLMTSGKLFVDLQLPKPSPDSDRFMLCGSPGMLKDTCKILDQRGFSEARNGRPGHYVIERAFVD
ncbi:MAG: ferredoxin--NADP reductase [Gammaproteobacteria bacterium]|nr:ferredoxin--NADP reductase [Gammaproteobacteria bacterium]NND40006.1 ferredoxin--NADP reductase [Pseudomonadales bacterium]MBT8151352.1 ferredoxin--NADP reductase [Gammaproteobacteria bacterium]NNL11217.1 ferredoxin--NADP reductase [Pseudomonadales bacterium]NNM12252.1 ferredoxin--NADP reductase [Pseudomonadales bacterium]